MVDPHNASVGEKLLVTGGDVGRLLGRSEGEGKDRNHHHPGVGNYDPFQTLSPSSHPFNYCSPFINLFQAAASSAASGSNLHHFLSPTTLSNLSNPQVASNLFRNVLLNSSGNGSPHGSDRDVHMNSSSLDSKNNNIDPSSTLLKPDQSILNESMKRILEKPDQTILNESMKRILEVVDSKHHVQHNAQPSPSDLTASSPSNRDVLRTSMNSNGFGNTNDLSLSPSNIKSDESPLKVGRVVEGERGPLECTLCSLSFHNFQELDSHRTSCEGSKIFKRTSSSASFHHHHASSRFDVPQSIRDSIMSASTQRIGESDGEDDAVSQRGSSSFEDDGSGQSDHKRARVRSVLSEETLQVLRAQYETNPRPKKHDIQRLSQQLNYSTRVIQVWFQNMRARDRRLGRPIPNIASGGNNHHDANSPDAHSRSLADRSPLLVGKSFLPLAANSRLDSNSFGLLSSIDGSKSHKSKFQSLLQSVQQSLSPSPAATPVPLNNNNNHHQKSSENVAAIAEQPLDLSVKFGPSTNNHRSKMSPSSHDGSHDMVNLSLQAIMCQSEAARMGVQNMTKEVNGSVSEQEEDDNESDRSPQGEESRGPSSVTESIECLSDSSKVRSPPVTTASGKIWKIADEVNHHHDSSLRGSLSPSGQDGSPGGQDGSLAGEMTGIFVCDHCDKSFNKQSSLARHKYEHSGNDITFTCL